MLQKSVVFKPTLYYKESSGIARWDFFDWGKKMESVMASAKTSRSGHHDGHQRHPVHLEQRQRLDRLRHLGLEDEVRQACRQADADMLDGGTRRIYWVGMRS